MGRYSKNVVLIVLASVCVVASSLLFRPAYAQAPSSCGTSGVLACDPSVGYICHLLIYSYPQWFTEDYTYRDLCLNDTEVEGAKPYRDRTPCMPHRVTELMSPLDLSPWFLTNIQSTDPARPGPYLGPVYRGGSDKQRYVNRLVQPDEKTAVNTCKQIVEPNSTTSPTDPVTARKELDSCTNQYLGHRSAHPRIPVENQGELPGIQQNRTDYCQPLRLVPMPEEEQEYRPSGYYVDAWVKTMMDPAHLVRDGLACKEPKYSSLGVGIKDPIQIRPDFGFTEINDLAEFQFERIYEATHPYSPRWDFIVNEREYYSPKTVIYSQNPICAVRCAGGSAGDDGKCDPSIPVDILTWRWQAFDMFIMQRIRFNIACYLNQKYCWIPLGCTADAPCCATKWSGRDKAPLWACGGVPIQTLCEHISKELVPANPLKMRYDGGSFNAAPGPQPVLENAFPLGVPQGYRFSDYFGNHRPYMRCWDTGLECGRLTPPPRIGADAGIDFWLLSDLGHRYDIMGAGREKESCLMGGGNELTNSQVDGEADPIMNWMELKLYSLRGTREAGINCLVKHERFPKLGSSEEFVLGRASGQYQALWDKENPATTKYRTFPWPLSWRGYTGDPISERRFPNLGGGGASFAQGLDDAESGDILVFDKDVVGKERLPYVAYVANINNKRAYYDPTTGTQLPVKGLEWVKLIAYNHGKFPDACASTDNWGFGAEYTVYKTDFPQWNKILFGKVGTHTKTCDDPMLSFCKEPLWGSVKRYDPREDVRE